MTTLIPEVPFLGLGTFGKVGNIGADAMLAGIEIGFRHIDSAQSYGNEADVGEAVRRSSLPRGDFFITTKVSPPAIRADDFPGSVSRSLEAFQFDHVDLLLLHWPPPADGKPLEYFLDQLAEAQRKRQARYIGVSNFTVALLQQAHRHLGPGGLAMNQIELHPYLQNRKVVAACRELGISVTGYMPVAGGKVNDDAAIARVARKHGASATQVTIAWLLAQGISAVPSSMNPAHLKANFAAQGLTLDAEDMASFDALDEGYRIINPAISPLWD